MPTRTAPRSRAGAYLSSRVRFGIKFGLETMRSLCEELHHPERAFASLLVAGTNGKGSVVAYADAALRASGLAVGRYTSPHLVHVNERIAVGGRDVGSAAFEAAGGRGRRAGARLVRRLGSGREGVAVEETSDGLESQPPRFAYHGVRTPPGAHQRDNALVALRLLEDARAAGVAVDLGAAAAALARTQWPGRLERVVIEGAPPLLLDGAHNPAAARALAAYLRDAVPFVLVFGVMT